MGVIIIENPMDRLTDRWINQQTHTASSRVASPRLEKISGECFTKDQFKFLILLRLDCVTRNSRKKGNKAGFMATPVPCGWAGATIEVT